ncbi:hypothetical protein HELRODRAFT_166915 [Helobdella robusta]|uniref:Fibronectin type-III domain-containing protein n=1 Tax=Helobdella robusta TaxID=6412 RepID=T1EYQ9_HELRO|nr:hypothetical protein HELRODRAFT_166915 [Helobdella robusta]ESO11844.1 hypothetical protein HELRODRAFT_166915 [Helobdella robusta]
MGSFSDWIQIHKNISGTSFVIKEFDREKDSLYRIKAENNFGISDPSMCVTFYGEPSSQNDQIFQKKLDPRNDKLPPKTPRDKPMIKDFENKLEISWHASEFSENAISTDVYYVVERRCPPSRNWIEIANDIKDTKYIMNEYRSEKDYMFRIRAGNEFGVSDPTLAASVFAKLDLSSLKKSSSTSHDFNEFKSKVKPRTIWDRPDIEAVKPDSFVLKWKASSVPQYAVQTDIWYVVEQRCLPTADWTTIASDLKDTHFKVTKFSPLKDYYFRVRAVNEFGMAEPSMPVMYKKNERVIPEIIGVTDEVQYGVEGRPSNITFKVRGYPEPSATWYFNNIRPFLTFEMASTLERYIASSRLDYSNSLRT